MQVIRGYNAACLMADLHTKTAPSADKVVDRFRHIDWEDATEEQRKKLLWVNNCGRKSAHLPLTPQEKEQIIVNQKDIPAFVNELAAEMRDEVFKIFKEVGLT